MEMERALAGVPSQVLDSDAAARFGLGAEVVVDRAEGSEPLPPLSAGPRSVLFVNQRGEVLGLGELVQDPGRMRVAIARPHVVFPWAVR
jgi:hypothetical protein